MNKIIKVMNIMIIAVMMLTLLSSTVFATATNPTDDALSKMQTSASGADTSAVTTIGGKISGIISTVGIVAAVIVLAVIGIKYMIGSASEKAEYKKVMIPYIIGAVLLLAASGIVGMLGSFANNFSNIIQ